MFIKSNLKTIYYKVKRNFRNTYKYVFKINGTNTTQVNEKNFLKFLKGNGGAGVKVFKGNTSFTQWLPLTLDDNGNLITGAPCQ